MGLTDMLSVAVEHREKDTLAWMTLHSFYQARVGRHASTGEVCRGAPARGGSGRRPFTL